MRNKWGAQYTPEQRAAWGAARDAARADHMKGVNALPRVATPKAAPRKSRTIELDVAGKCLSEAYWRDNGNGDGTGTLFVTFTRTGDDYVYYDVEKEVALELDGGEAFNALIRDYYEYS
jgi:hypothetical protein